jgi:hypothetical protein
MDQRWVARAIALGRCAIGASLVIAPQTVGAVWLGDSTGPGGVPLLRALGVRDLVLGLGTLDALDTEGPAQTWVAAGAAADAVDAGALILAAPATPRRAWGVVVLAAGAAVLGSRAAAELS